ncbi:MAG: hypothetical protein A3H27_06040 [Acidobacteria bacterium RIFCSPLOWO2_02_FULL_59_13]|nr:MAG: hypothetical protein A3H27_06040 [Acidobacteria bacterium RIFCSPLOWO2_02_FULL_59_13]
MVGPVLSYSLLLLFFFLLYSQLPLLIPALQGLRLVYAVGGAAIVAVLVEKMLSHGGWELVWPESYLLLGLLAAAAISCFGALWPRYAVDNTLDLAKAVALSLVLLSSVNSTRRLRVLIWFMVLGGLFPALGTLRNYFQGNLMEGGRAGWVGIFANPNELAYSLVLLVPLAISLAAGVPRWVVVLLGGIIATYIAAIYVSFSRGGMIGLLAVLAVIGLRGRSIPVRVLMILLLAASLAFIAQGWSRDEGFTQLGTDANFRERLATMQAGFAMFADHPISGVGLGCSVIAWPLYAPPDVHARRWLVIHNTFLQSLSETGIVGFLCFTLLLGAALHDAREITRRGPESGSGDSAQLADGLGKSLWGFVVCGLSGGFILSWFPYILVGAVSSLKKITKESSPGAPAGQPRGLYD